MKTENSRIDVADVLRGFAVMPGYYRTRTEIP